MKYLFVYVLLILVFLSSCTAIKATDTDTTIYVHTQSPDRLCRLLKSKSDVEIGGCAGMVEKTCLVFMIEPSMTSKIGYEELKKHEDNHCREWK